MEIGLVLFLCFFCFCQFFSKLWHLQSVTIGIWWQLFAKLWIEVFCYDFSIVAIFQSYRFFTPKLTSTLNIDEQKILLNRGYGPVIFSFQTEHQELRWRCNINSHCDLNYKTMLNLINFCCKISDQSIFVI